MTLIFPTLRPLPGIEFRIAVESDSSDPIGQAIPSGFFTYSPAQQAVLTVLERGEQVVDLGAHIGTFSLAAAAAGCHVAAVEASPHNVRLLEQSVRENGFDGVRVVSAAVSDRPGRLRFVEMGPFGQVCDDGYGGPSIDVRAVRLDDLLKEIGWDRVDYLKIDVEGAELAAFRGMERLLSSSTAPTIVYESNGHILHSHDLSSADLIAFLDAHAYRSYSVRDRTLRPVRASDLQIPTVADYLAVKDPPGIVPILERLPGWNLGSRETDEETVAQILAEAALDIVAHRQCLAKTLAKGDANLLSDERVRRTIEGLLHDSAPEVREAARAAARLAAGFSRSAES